MKCRICQTEVASLGQLSKHRKAAHPQVVEAQIQNLVDKREAKHPRKTKGTPVATVPVVTGNNGHDTAAPAGIVPVADFRLAQPEPVTIRSSLLWLAQKASVRYFGWPEMPIEDFLESYLHYTLKAFGIHLYAMISDEELKKGGNHGGNGQNSIGAGSTTGGQRG